MLRRLILSSQYVSELKKFAMDCLPLESCAILAGQVKQGDAVVSKVMYTKNANKSPTSFSIEPSELFDIYIRVEEEGLEIVGIFHSHPAPAEPSPTDVKYMELNPIPWLIMSTTKNELMASIFENEGIRKLELVMK